MDISEEVKKAVEKHSPAAWDLSNYLAENPEISGCEVKACGRVTRILRDAGFALEAPYCAIPAAFRAVFDNSAGAAGTSSIGVLTEYDALPGIGHGCGHNLHGALSVLCALALKELAPYYRGVINVFGTPAEETDGSKIAMAAAGAFDGLSLAMMMHSFSGGAGEPCMDALCLRGLTFKFYGSAAHTAAAPEKGHSALAAARKCLDLIDANRECFTRDFIVNGIITKGGDAPNIIPEYAELNINLRSAKLQGLEILDNIVSRCAEGAALALGCKTEKVKTYADFLNMIRIPLLEAEVERLFRALGEPVKPARPPSGSTDMGNVSYRCPAVQPLLSITGEDIAWHTAAFERATRTEEARREMERGAEILVNLALKMFCDTGWRDAVYAEFLAARGAAYP